MRQPMEDAADEHLQLVWTEDQLFKSMVPDTSSLGLVLLRI